MHENEVLIHDRVVECNTSGQSFFEGITSEQSYVPWSIRKVQLRLVKEGNDKVLYNAKKLCSFLIYSLNLLDCVKTECMNLLDELHKDGHLHLKKEHFFCACVLVACRDSNDPSCARTSKEISKVMAIEFPEKIANDVKTIMELRPTRPIKPEDVVCRFCGYLNVDFHCEKEARKVLEFLHSYRYCDGKQEARCAAVAIAVALETQNSDVKIDRIEHIANRQFGVSTSAFRKDIRKLKAKSSYIGTLLREQFSWN